MQFDWPRGVHSPSYAQRTDGQNGRKSRRQASCRHEVPTNVHVPQGHPKA